jgi:hypothetical protein
MTCNKLALTSSTSGGRSVGIVRSRTKATELVKTPVNKVSSQKPFYTHTATHATI